MRKYTSLIAVGAFSILSLGLSTKVAVGGAFDWMNPNKWFNNRDYDRDYYRGYGYNGYGYPGYGHPGWGGYGYGYPGWGGYPPATYPGYVYPVQPQQQQNNPPAPAPAPIPQ